VDIILFLLGFIFSIAILTVGFGFFILQVEGPSMMPEYHHKDLILVRFKYDLEEGKDYVFQTPYNKIAIKRLKFLYSGNQCFFEGLNEEESYDSYHYGLVDAESIIAKVLWHPKHQQKEE